MAGRIVCLIADFILPVTNGRQPVINNK